MMPWEHALQLAAGWPCAPEVAQSIAAELTRVRDALARIAQAPNHVRADVTFRILCRSLDIEA